MIRHQCNTESREKVSDQGILTVRPPLLSLADECGAHRRKPGRSSDAARILKRLLLKGDLHPAFAKLGGPIC